jgi:hypothetical protein
MSYVISQAMITARIQEVSDRFFYEACFNRDTSNSYIEGYFDDCTEDSDSPTKQDEIFWAEGTRDATWGPNCLPIETFRTGIAPDDQGIVQAQGAVWLNWILTNTHLRKNESVDKDQSYVGILQTPFNGGIPAYCLMVFRKTNQSGIWYVIPSLRFDWNYQTLSFVQDPTGSPISAQGSYRTNPKFTDLTEAKQKAEHRKKWASILSSCLAIGETAAFVFGPMAGAGVQGARSLFDAKTSSHASALTDAVNDLKSFIKDQSESEIINDVASAIEARNLQISDFMTYLSSIPTTIAANEDLTAFDTALKGWMQTFHNYVVGTPTDQLPRALLDLVNNKFSDDGFPVFMAGVNVHNLCWQYYLYLANIYPPADLESHKSDIVSYLNEMTSKWIKLAVRFGYESIEGRISTQIVVQNNYRTLQDSYTDLQMDIDKKRKPFSDNRRYFNNSYGQWISDNPEIPLQISQFETATAALGQYVAMPLSKEQLAGLGSIQWFVFAQSVDSQSADSPWKNGRYVQYGVRFRYQDILNKGTTTRSAAIWSPERQIEGWIMPYLVHLPVDPYLSAANRELIRRFGDKNADGSITWDSEDGIAIQNLSDYTTGQIVQRTTEIWD